MNICLTQGGRWWNEVIWLREGDTGGLLRKRQGHFRFQKMARGEREFIDYLRNYQLLKKYCSMLLVNFKNAKLHPLKPSILGSKMYKNHPVRCYVYRTLCPTFPPKAHFLVLQLPMKLPLQNS